MIEYSGWVRNGVVVFEPPVSRLEGCRVRVRRADPTPMDPDDRSFWESSTLEEVLAEQGNRPGRPFELLLGGWPEEELDDAFEEEWKRWRSGGVLPSP